MQQQSIVSFASPRKFHALGHAEAHDPTQRRFIARAMTMTPLVGTAGWFVPAGADLSVLNTGRCPVLLDHSTTVRDVVGVIETAWIEGEAVMLLARMGVGASADLAWQNLAAGVWCNVSLGNSPLEMERRDNGAYIFKRWQPYELSLVWSGWCPDASVERNYDLAAIYAKLEASRRARAQDAAQKAEQELASLTAAIRERWQRVAVELAPELGIPTERVVQAAESAADREIGAVSLARSAKP